MHGARQQRKPVRRLRSRAVGLVCLCVLLSGCVSQPGREPVSSPGESEPSASSQVWSQEIENHAGALAGLGEHGLDRNGSGDIIKGVLTVEAGCVFVDLIIGGDPMRVRHFQRTGDPVTDEQQVRAFVRLPEGETVYNEDVRAVWVGAANYVTEGDYVVLQGRYGDDFSPGGRMFEDACQAHTDIMATELYPLRDTGRTGQTVQFVGQFPYHEALDYPDSDRVYGTLVIEEPCAFVDVTDDGGEFVLTPSGEPLRAILRLPRAVTRYYPDNGQMWVDDVGPVASGKPVVVSAEMTGAPAWTEFGDGCAAHIDMIATSVRLAGPKKWPQAEPLVGLWPYDPQQGYFDEGVFGFLEIDEPCVYLYGGGLGGERVYTADGVLDRSLLRLPGGFTRYDSATGEIWVHDSGPMRTGDEVEIAGSGGVPIQERPLPGGCTARDFTVAKAMSPGRGPRLEVQEVTEADPQSLISVFPPIGDGDGVARWTVEIVESVPHDPEAFTQGLEVADGIMYESTGLWGRSSVRVVDPDTGGVTARVDLPAEFFGEGLTIAGDEILQLTWQSGTAFVYDRATLGLLREHSYAGEGWGLCEMGGELIMTDGSDRLARRNLETFDLLDMVTVTAPGYVGQLDHLNELECVEGLVIANVWQTGSLLVIDPESGRVVAAIDAGPLIDDVMQDPVASGIDVLNGVAVAGSDGTLWMTGKLWPRLYRVRLVEVR